MAEEKKVFQFEEVSKHNVASDCWLVIDGKVYDLTLFMEEHPGGDEVLLAATGKDATNDFEDVGHSKSAREMMSQYYIGDVDASTIPAKRAYIPPLQGAQRPENNSEFIVKLLQFLVPVLIIGLAFGVRYYTKYSEEQ